MNKLTSLRVWFEELSFFSNIDSWDESYERENEMTNIFNWLSIFLSISTDMICENDIDELNNRFD